MSSRGRQSEDMVVEEPDLPRNPLDPQLGEPAVRVRHWLITLSVAGTVLGLLESTRGLYLQGGGVDIISAVGIVGIAAASMALCGALLAFLFIAIEALVRLLPKFIVMAAAIATLLATTVPLGSSVLVSSLICFALVALAPARYAGGSSLIILLAWLGLQWALAPLYAGHAIDLAFTTQQISTATTFAPPLALVLLTVSVVPLLDPPVSRWARALVFLCNLALITITTFMSSVFLVRLWGFNTLQYLQVAIIVVSLTSLATVLRLLASARPSGRFGEIVIQAGTLATLLALISSVAIGYQSGSHTPIGRTIGTSMPHTEMLLEQIHSSIDWDGDGFSGILGGGDCKEFDDRFAPDTADVPGDGKDQNCFGGDLKSLKHPYLGIAPSITRPERAEGTPPRLAVLLVVDTLRYDAMDAGMPVLGEIAANSASFQNARSQSNNTLESFPFMLHLSFRNLDLHRRPWTVGQLLQESGIQSAGIFQDDTERWWTAGMDEVFFNFDRIERPPPPVGLASLPSISKRVVNLVNEHSDGDLFLFVHINSLHDSFIHLIDGDRVAFSGANIGEVLLLLDQHRLAALMRENYNSVTRDIDASIAPIWEALRAAENAGSEVLLIVTSDHGEEFGDHGGFFHMGTLYEELLRVPLLVYRTGAPPREDRAPTALYQIPNTLLDFFDFEGAAVDRFTLLETRSEPPPIFAFFSNFVDPQKRAFAVFDDDRKLIFDRSRNTLELYDLSEDPGEQRNLFGVDTYADIQNELTARMDTLLFFMDYGDYLLPRRLYHVSQLAEALRNE